jgi:hypothetical protein
MWKDRRWDTVVSAVVQSGTVRTGQLLQAVLPTLCTNQARLAALPRSTPTTVVTVSVVRIERFGQPLYPPHLSSSLILFFF